MKDKKGFTLIEVLVALVILALLLIGLLSGLMTATDLKIRNMLRNKAIKIAQECAEIYRTVKDESSAQNTGVCKGTEIVIGNNKIRLNVDSKYTATPWVSSGTAQTKKVEITVSWNYKGKEYQYKLETFVDIP